MTFIRNSVSGIAQWITRSLRTLSDAGSGHFPALDGLRALAITLVIASHSKNDFVHAGGSAEGWFFTGVNYAWAGVDLFFVLSGFLIGRMLLEELKRTGTVQVFPFLVRRGLRVWPLYYFVSAVAFLILLWRGNPPRFGEIVPDLLFLTDYTKETLAYGSWSLSIEEQFYLIAAMCAFFAREWLARSGPRAIGTLVALFALAPLIRRFEWKRLLEVRGIEPFAAEWDHIHSYLHTHYDGLVMGLFFAAVHVFWASEAAKRKRIEIILATGALILAVATFFDRIAFQYSFAAIFFGWMVWHGIERPASALSRLLSWPGLRIVARLSFGMYLWYRFPLWKIAEVVMGRANAFSPGIQYAFIFAIAFSVAAFVATFTYVFVERPFLELRSRAYRKNYANRLDYAEMAVSRQ